MNPTCTVPAECERLNKVLVPVTAILPFPTFTNPDNEVVVLSLTLTTVGAVMFVLFANLNSA